MDRAMNEIYRGYYQSEIGIIQVTATDSAIKTVEFVESETVSSADEVVIPDILKICLSQLDEYFHAKRRQFVLSLSPDGTCFQKKVWQQLLSLPYGATASYLEIAQAIGNSRAVRAVGAANGRNPISIIIPCHRVIGSNGKLTGYGGGLWRKEWLLNHEGWRTHPQMRLL
jgi:methylated-DNA-[protein]-cysteine S-methyltransferase